MSLAQKGKQVFRKSVPVGVRKVLARWVGRQPWIPNRYWHSMELVRDLSESDPEAYHRFLWSNHLAYAETYEVDQRFGAENLNESRRMLFDDLASHFERMGLDPARDVGSVFEVGCSMGYLLRHLETGIFRGAALLEGMDIDRHAIEHGARHLASIGSRVRVRHGDMADLDEIFEGRAFDVVLAPGVLIYLERESAREVVATMLRHTGRLLVLTGLAHPEIDNRELRSSLPREYDSAMIHNMDEMVAAAGGEVVFRRWEGPRIVDGNTLYFVFAAPSAG